ncbi:hypothetical protein ACH79_36490 [Bradyrhizobium sp. CCBAU 051011]|uniref:DUF4132 domain-containing protein n=1 Tax=Bradyrhizobium sp. CCBAU 051011 TaxID=858422 RepID=UPI001373F868|nr:DUF4132 domain-containing protein [Bradyrhizobium sp. CCBAU 051011]QHO77325.1 hypothetical protein ACH79_36490 [Bradyrhizobium sp. CCBAU 051011]
MFDFLKSVIGIGKPAGIATEADNATAREIVTDLKRLETVSPDLAKRAIGYVLTGEGSSVLLQIEQQASAVQNALSHYHYNTPTTAAQTTAQAAIKARSNVIGRRHGSEATWIRRYFEVLTLPHKGSRWGMFSHQGPSPLWLRGLFAQGELSLQTKLATDFNTVLSWRDAEDSATVFALDLLVLEKVNQYYFSGHDIGSKFDFKRGLLAEKQAAMESFAKYDRPGQAIFIHILKQFDLVKDEYFHFIYQQYLLTTSKAVREAAQNALLASPPETLAASATQTLADGNPTARAQAAQILPLVMGEQARPLLENHLAKETSKTVRKVIELGLGPAVVRDGAAETARTLKGDGAEGYLAADGTEVLSPPLAAMPGPTPLPDSVKAGYCNLLDKAHAQWMKHYEYQKALHENATAEQRKAWRKPELPKPIEHSVADRYCALLASDRPIDEDVVVKIGNISPFAPYNAGAAADPPFNNPDLTLWHLCRARSVEAGRTRNHNWLMGNLLNGHGAIPAAIHARLTNGLDLRTLATLMRQDLEPKALAIHVVNVGISEDLPAETIWPLLAAHFDVLDQALGQVAATDFREPPVLNALSRLRLFPKLPARYFNTVLIHALSAKKSVNKPARALLLGIDGIEQRLLPFLSDSKQDVRSGVAQMLGAIGAESAIEPLKKALGKEKSELVRAAVLGALRRLNVDISSYVSPEILIKEATTGLKGKKAKDIGWFPLDSLPALSWASGGTVPSDVPRWWIALAGKLAQAGGNTLFSLWLDQLTPESAEALGRHILGSFLRYDATHCSEDEANAHAKAHAQQRYEQYQEYAKRWDNEFYRSYTYEKAFADLRAEKLGIYLNNAQADRGILGLATRAEGTFAVQMVRTYMRDHYKRTAQVKALTEYLSGNTSSAALQLLLSIARRHRTNAVQVLAQELVERLADERNWTTDELADRTIPTAGLDERGTLDLEIGSRVYQARLDAEDVLTLYNPDGKVVKSLPQVSDGPDKESAAEAKKALSNAKKELKQVHEFQAKRLYEALCVGRRWQLADWQRFLLEHPIVGRLVQRLVWLGLDAQGEIVASFRPLEDLSLTDSSDNAVDPASFAAVQLAHRSLFTAEQSEAWKQHLADYKVDPLFNQLDRPVLTSAVGTSIEDRTGHIIEAFKLRSAAQKLGYERAQAEDGGWFTQYIKPFGGIAINAVIEFTGSPLPEENRAVALVAAKFVRARKGARSAYGVQIALNEVPSVLLSEVWNDLHQIAGAGSGFAEDWRNKVGW